MRPCPLAQQQQQQARLLTVELCADVRVPRSALLDQFSQVARDGSFTSSIKRPRDRCGLLQAVVQVSDAQTS